MSALARTATSKPQAPRGQTRRLGAPERREQLVATAQKLFGDRGYRATTMEHIANAAGVTKPLLYQHFASKRALYLELVQQVSNELLEALKSAYRRASGPREMVENGYRAYFELIVTHEDAFRLLFGRQAPDDPELSSAAHEVETAVLDVIEKTMPDDLAPEHRRLLAYSVVGMAEGGTRFWVESVKNDASARGRGRTITSPEDVRILARRVSRVAWAGLRAIQDD
ncbi:MAG: TetR/AcrR family transcriptional regulator [Acidimicrobiales bacterium]